jgi:hypothetical protein
MNGFTAELLMAMITPKFLIVSLKFVGMSKYFRGLESINGAQKMKKKFKFDHHIVTIFHIVLLIELLT